MITDLCRRALDASDSARNNCGSASPPIARLPIRKNDLRETRSQSVCCFPNTVNMTETPCIKAAARYSALGYITKGTSNSTFFGRLGPFGPLGPFVVRKGPNRRKGRKRPKGEDLSQVIV